MPDQTGPNKDPKAKQKSWLDEAEEKSQKLIDIMVGPLKKPAKEISGGPRKFDNELKKQTGESTDAEGADKGELGKPWKDTFNFQN